MNLREEILANHSQQQRDIIVNWIGGKQSRFDQLFDIFLNGDSCESQRASWPLSKAVLSHPKFIFPHFSSLLKNLLKPGIHDAIKRNSLRLMEDIEIPEKFHGEGMNICFNYATSMNEKPAIKAFSLTVLQNLMKTYPDIKHELQTIIEDQWDYESPAFKARAKKILKAIESGK
ncbi:MAG: hypothetical protein IPH18_01645 [Chitinophagaceae bacterium]|nr:hypothetical protein [Chitinophagaceae bacterium]